MSGRIVKTISLDKATAELASNIPNFSAWIRQQLLIEHIAQGGTTLHVYPEDQRHWKVQLPINEYDSYGRRKMVYLDTGLCNPHSKKGRCYTCWPPERTIEGHVAKMIEDRLGEEE